VAVGGSLEDPRKEVIAGAKVVLTHQAQGSVICEVTTSVAGTFVPPPVLPGSYTITVKATDYKKYTTTDLHAYTTATARVFHP
jgi:hypothetical protein